MTTVMQHRRGQVCDDRVKIHTSLSHAAQIESVQLQDVAEIHMVQSDIHFSLLSQISLSLQPNITV